MIFLGEDCNCKLKCFSNISNEERKVIFENFYSLPSKDVQDAYLYGLIKQKIVKRRRPRSGDRPQKDASYDYMVIYYFKLLINYIYSYLT